MTVKQKIINKSDNLFRTYGLRGVTMDNISSELGMSKKTIYKYFQDKESIATASINFYFSGLLSEINRLNKTCKNSIEYSIKLSRFFRSTINDINPLYVKDVKKYYPSLDKIINEYKSKIFFKGVSDNIVRGKKEGYIRKEIDEVILSKLRIEEMEIAFDQDVFPYQEYDFRKVQVQFFDHFMRGILTQKGLEVYTKLFNQ